MKIISWDIGIENLAYCIMDNDNILMWETIDILKDIRQNEYICEGLLKNGKECNNKAKCYENIENIKKYYCKKHGKKLKDIPEHELCEYTKKNNQNCKKKANFYENIDNENKKYYCNQHKHIANNELHKYITVKNVSFFEKSIFLYNILNKLDDILDVDEVIIENQMHAEMKSIQILLYSYYLQEGIIKNGRINEIHLMNATQKMTVYDGPKMECNIKDPHDRNKYLAKKHCEYLLQNNLLMLEYYNSHKKKDDLADTYLQALYFLKCKKLIL